MGANIASDVAADEYVETTVASEDPHTAQLVADIFRTPHLHTEVSTDLATVEFCGALKNIVAVGAGEHYVSVHLVCHVNMDEKPGLFARELNTHTLLIYGTRPMLRFCMKIILLYFGWSYHGTQF